MDVELILELVEADSNQGMCLECEAVAECVEPDARKYECESCGKRAVYGAEEILLTLI